MIVDYLTWTVQKDKEDGLKELVRTLDPGAVAIDPVRGYSENYVIWGKGFVRWANISPDVSARISIGGQALAIYAGGGGNVFNLLSLVGDKGGICTRIDLAFDWPVDASSVIEKIIGSLKKHEYVSRWKLENRNSLLRMYHPLSEGDSLYLGSKSSDSRLLFYDKAAERGEEEPRLRAEFRVRREQAQAIVEYLMLKREGSVEFIKGLILGYIDIKEAGNDSNNSRLETSEWWKEMWGSQKNSLRLGSDMPTEDDCRAWFEKLGPTVAILLDLDGGDLSRFISNVVSIGKTPIAKGGRWRPLHDAKLKAWRRARLEVDNLKD